MANIPNWQLLFKMVEINNSNTITLTGEVVGIYDQDGKRFIKLRYNKGFIDINIEDDADVYLGDKVKIDSYMDKIKMSHCEEEI